MSSTESLPKPPCKECITYPICKARASESIISLNGKETIIPSERILASAELCLKCSKLHEYKQKNELGFTKLLNAIVEV